MKHFMNPSYGKHVTQGMATGAPKVERAPAGGEFDLGEQPQTLTCPECGAELTVESAKEERREAEPGTEGAAGGL